MPVLTLIFGVSPPVAVATSLASVLPTTAAGAVSHYREGNVDIRTGLILGIGGIIGTIIGAYIANLVPPYIFKKSLGVFMLLMLIPILRSLLKRRKDKKEDENKKTIILTGYKRVLASFFGVAGGILAGVFGLSGTPPVSMGLYILGLPAIMVVGTTVFVLIFNSITGIGSYYLLGRLDIPLILLLGSGAVVGAFIGPKLLKKMGSNTFEKIYGPLMVSISLIFGIALIIS